jgi:hypothetical protein
VSLQPIQVFEIPTRVVGETEEALATAGNDGYELFVLWTGHVHGTTFEVLRTYVPTQNSFRLDSGLCVRVEGNELHLLNQWLYNEKQVLGIQIHTHPKEAFHSETDDAYPIVTVLGGLSIVVPFFCREGLWSGGTVVYRLAESGWIQIPVSDANRLLRVAS